MCTGGYTICHYTVRLTYADIQLVSTDKSVTLTSKAKEYGRSGKSGLYKEKSKLSRITLIYITIIIYPII